MYAIVLLNMEHGWWDTEVPKSSQQLNALKQHESKEETATFIILK